jgi:hypothetical protein
MFFLLRLAFWIGVVCVLLPSGGAKTSTDAQIDPAQAITVASAAVSDARGFCARQPQACIAGGEVAAAIGHKAEAGARTLYRFISATLNEKSSDTPAATQANLASKPDDKAVVVPVSAHGHGTLTGADLQPAYHAPVPLPPRREKPRSAV